MISHIGHFEIGCRDREKTADFYAKMFDWKTEPNPNGTMLRTGGDVGGHITALGHEPHSYTIFYVMVNDVREALQRAVSLGGKTLVGPLPLPHGTSFGWFADPEGNTIGVYAESARN
jgi:predicted enzyme related to lactoylglutathione lyase